MNWKVSIALLALSLLSPAQFAGAGSVVDRIVATVNGKIILQSDWEDASRYEAFIAERSLNTFTAADRKAALDHLIDQELLREQMRAADSLQPTEQEVEGQIKEIRKQYESEKTMTDAEWKDLLATARLTEEDVRRRVTLQLELIHLVDVHLRPTANISSANVERYYQQELVPQLQQAGAKETPLTQVAPKIRELLTQQKINELLVTWLQTLRAGSEIHTHLYSPANESRAQ
ncbi:MAG: SurA N-terminal domain-containing protein [Terriglobales bacterium]